MTLFADPIADPAGAEQHRRSTAILRLGELAALSPADVAAIEASASRALRVAAGGVIHAGGPARSPYVVLAGWAGRVRFLKDQRQVVDLILPGELIGLSGSSAINSLPVMAFDAVLLADAAPIAAQAKAEPDGGLALALARTSEQEVARLIERLVSVGRLDARQRTCRFLLETYRRLAPAGLARRGAYLLPLTQSNLAELLGMGVVHTNRILQQLRKDGLISLKGSEVRLLDIEGLRAASGVFG